MTVTATVPIRHPLLKALPNVPDPLLTPSDAASALNLDRRRAGELVAAGALGAVYDSGGQMNRYRVEGARIHAIAAEGRVPLEQLPTGLLVKVGAAMPEAEPTNERDWVGYDALLSEADKMLALTRWWLIREPERFTGQFLLATLHQIIVEVYQISGAPVHHPDENNPRIGFTITPASTGLRETWIGRRAGTRRATRWDPTGSNA
jgi:hypothetical protein